MEVPFLRTKDSVLLRQTSTDIVLNGTFVRITNGSIIAYYYLCISFSSFSLYSSRKYYFLKSNIILLRRSKDSIWLYKKSAIYLIILNRIRSDIEFNVYLRLYKSVSIHVIDIKDKIKYLNIGLNSLIDSLYRHIISFSDKIAFIAFSGSVSRLQIASQNSKIILLFISVNIANNER